MRMGKAKVLTRKLAATVACAALAVSMVPAMAFASPVDTNADGSAAGAYKLMSADMSGVKSILFESWLGKDNGDTRSAAYMSTNYSSSFGYYYEFALSSSYRSDTYYAYDAVSCKQLKAENVNGWARVDVSDLFGTTAKILITNTALSEDQIKALNTLPDNMLCFLTLPSYEELGQYYCDNGYAWDSHTYNVYYEAASCNQLRLSFAMDSNDDVKWTIYVDDEKVKTGGTSSYNQSYTFGNYLPGSSHKLVFEVSTTYNGIPLVSTYSKTVKTASFAKPTVSATKLSSSKASVKVSVPAAEAGKGLTLIDLYCGSKLVKSFKTTGKTSYYVTYNKAGAGSGKYVAKASWVADNSVKANSATVKTKANTVKFNSSVSPTSYKMYSQYFVTKSISYSGKYLVVKGWFLNRHIYSTKIKTEISVLVNGKKITGTKTLTSKKLGQNAKQAVTVKIKANTVADLLNYSVTVKHPAYEVS